jgi:hypothetical protein
MTVQNPSFHTVEGSQLYTPVPGPPGASRSPGRRRTPGSRRASRVPVDTSTVAPTDGQALVYNNASGLWKPATPASGALVLLEQHTAANVASLDFTSISATYDEYIFEIVNLQPIADDHLLIRMSTDGGATFDTGTNYDDYYHSRNKFNFEGNGSEADTAIRTTNGDHNHSLNTGICGHIRLFQPGSTTLYKTVMGDLTINAGGPVGYVGNAQFSGWYRSLTAVNAIRFLMSASNINTGTIRMYGVAK